VVVCFFLDIKRNKEDRTKRNGAFSSRTRTIILVKWNSEDVEDHIVLTTNDDNLPTAVAVHCINSRHHFTFAAGSVEMANLYAHQLNQQQNVDTLERGMSLFDMYISEEKDENEIV
jgi:hypothetical protein